MLTQLSRLSVVADGRYATPGELQFLKSYSQSLDLRVSAYEKLRAAETEIITEAEAKIRAIDPNAFISPTGKDYVEIWRRDTLELMRYAAAALLFNDPDRLREGLLLWHTTLAKSFKFARTCKTCFQVMPDVVKAVLTPEEAALFKPLLDLNKVTLG
jgi:hypothetical protein